MADNIIRNDLIKLDFDIHGLKEFSKLHKDVDQFKKQLTGGLNNDVFKDVKNGAKGTIQPLEKMKKATKQATEQVTNLGKKASTTAFNGLKKMASVSFKALTVSLGMAAGAVAGLVAKSVSAYADFEQLKGGVETLFGVGGQSLEEYAKSVGKSTKKAKSSYDKLMASQNTVLKNANGAFKTAGLSANEYMDTVTSFSASLISSCGGDTKKAADLAHVAIVDMSDNANKMGTDMGTIIGTYQSLAKGNYAMLDNLKLGKFHYCPV